MPHGLRRRTFLALRAFVHNGHGDDVLHLLVAFRIPCTLLEQSLQPGVPSRRSSAQQSVSWACTELPGQKGSIAMGMC